MRPRLLKTIQARNRYKTHVPNVGSGYNAYLDAMISEANLQGYTVPSTTELDAKDTLFNALDAVSWFAECAGMYLFKSEQENFSRINCISPSTKAIYGNSPFVANTGVQGDAISKYVETNINPSLHTSILSNSNIAYHFWLIDSDSVTTGRMVCNLSQNIIVQKVTAGHFYRLSDSAASTTATQHSETGPGHLYSIIRDAAGQFEVFIDGVSQKTITSSAVALANEVIDLMRKPDNTKFGDAGFSMFAVTNAAIKSNMAAIYTAFNAYL